MVGKVESMSGNKAIIAIIDGGILQAGQIVNIRAGKTRTLDQNALYWLLLEYAGRQVGHTAEELHEVMKAKFLKHMMKIGGEVVFVTRSTASLTKQEFGEYFDKVTALLAEYGVNVATFWQEYERITGGEDEKKSEA